MMIMMMKMMVMMMMRMMRMVMMIMRTIGKGEIQWLLMIMGLMVMIVGYIIFMMIYRNLEGW